jgi:hypothetical protein
MGYGHGIKVAQNTLGYLAMDDELKNRMELACGEIRELGSASNAQETSKKNRRKVDEVDLAFKVIKDKKFVPRDLEILAEKLVNICVDIIEFNTRVRLKHS